MVATVRSRSWGKQEGAVSRKEAGEGMPPRGAGRACSPEMINQVSPPESYTSLKASTSDRGALGSATSRICHRHACPAASSSHLRHFRFRSLSTLKIRTQTLNLTRGHVQLAQGEKDTLPAPTGNAQLQLTPPLGSSEQAAAHPASLPL